MATREQNRHLQESIAALKKVSDEVLTELEASIDSEINFNLKLFAAKPERKDFLERNSRLEAFLRAVREEVQARKTANAA